MSIDPMRLAFEKRLKDVRDYKPVWASDVKNINVVPASYSDSPVARVNAWRNVNEALTSYEKARGE